MLVEKDGIEAGCLFYVSGGVLQNLLFYLEPGINVDRYFAPPCVRMTEPIVGL
jgi:hypothetical protein